MSSIKNPFDSRNFRYGAVSMIITVTVIVFIVLLNALLTFLFKKYPLNIDLTENRAFTISRDTEEFLASLKQDVVIYVMNTEARFTGSSPSEYFVQANEVIHKYAQHSSRIRLEYVDLIRSPDFSSRYPDENLNVNDILVTCGGRYRVLASSDLFNIRSSYYGNYVAASKAEQAMTSALMNITSDKKSLAALTGGHGEGEIGAFTELLKLNSYETADVNLFTGDVPDGASVLIIAAPARDFSVAELRKIDAFLEGGDKRLLFYLASPAQPDLPNLAGYLGEWGIAVDQGVVFETDNSRLISVSPYIAVVDYAGDEEYSQNMVRRELLAVIPESRPLRAVFDQARYRNVTPLLTFSPTSGIRPPDAPNDWSPSPLQIRGNVPVLMLSSQFRNNAAGQPVEAHVLVSGSLFALDGSILGSPNIANSAYFLDLLGTLTGREDVIYIQDKTLGFAGLGANVLQIMMIAVVFTVLLPLGVLGAGIAVWLRRRHK
jgi:hypothetical protein